jgi:hypothetical protein
MIREKIYLRILSLLKIHLTGADILGQAIGIGKGKRDLTRIRSNPTTSRNRTRNSLESSIQFYYNYKRGDFVKLEQRIRNSNLGNGPRCN